MEHIGRKYSRGIEWVYPKAIIYYNVVLARRKQFQRSRVYSIFHLYYYSIFKLIPWIRFLLFWDDLLLFHLLLQLFYVVLRFCLFKKIS